jgi:transposase
MLTSGCLGTKAVIALDIGFGFKAQNQSLRQLRQANEILRKASAYFAQAELDRPFKL